MKVFWHPDCLLHNPPHEILDGRQTPYLEAPRRITIVRDALAEEPAHFQITNELDNALDLKERILKVHDAEYLEYLESAYEKWVADGGDEIGVYPETFPHISLISKKPRDPKSLSPIARAGLYCFDLSSPITKDTFKSILSSLRVALSAAKALPELSPGEGAFALCRPPGHHAMPSLSGGYCFVNNIAIAARYLQSLLPSQVKIAILDIDYHHGNGTQHIFYDDPSVLYVSIHAENDYPCKYPSSFFFEKSELGHTLNMDFTGFPSETGEGEGQGFNINIPLPRGTTGDEEYYEALTRAVGKIKEFDPVYLLVSLGIDTHEGDPICDFKISTEAYLQIGRIISTAKKPTLFVFEGGYYYHSLGESVRNVLNGFQLRM